METSKFCFNVGNPAVSILLEKFETPKPITVSVSSIEKYLIEEIAPKSIYQDLLVTTGGPRCWDLARFAPGTQQGKIITTDDELDVIAKKAGVNATISIDIQFDKEKFLHWEENQKKKKNIPVPEIIESEEDSKHLRITIGGHEYKMIYKCCYKIREDVQEKPNIIEQWKELDAGSYVILLSQLWQFKKYTIEVCFKNRYSNIYGNSYGKPGFEIKSPKIMFGCDLDNSSNTSILGEKQEFEKFNHDQVYQWCEKQLESNHVFNDVRNMKHGKVSIGYILAMIDGFKQLDDYTSMWHDLTKKKNIDNLLQIEEGKKYKQETENDKNKDACSYHLCCSILSRLRIIAFQKNTRLEFVPNNDYVIYFWCFFHDIPQNDVYIRCLEQSYVLCFFCLFVCFYVGVVYCVYAGLFGQKITELTGTEWSFVEPHK